MSYNPEDEAEILRLHRANPKRFSPFKASNSTGLPLEVVFEIIENNKESLARTGERFGGFGRPDIQKHLVARRRAMGEPWDNKDDNIANARAAFEAGTHILATGRDGPWLLLYSFPRTGRARPQPSYFSVERS